MLAVFPYLLGFLFVVVFAAAILLFFLKIRNSKFITVYTNELDKDPECEITVSQLIANKKAIDKDIIDRGKELDDDAKKIIAEKKVLDKVK